MQHYYTSKKYLITYQYSKVFDFDYALLSSAQSIERRHLLLSLLNSRLAGHS